MGTFLVLNVSCGMNLGGILGIVRVVCLPLLSKSII